MYQNKVNSSLTFTQRPGCQAHNCKMVYYYAIKKALKTNTFESNRKLVERFHIAREIQNIANRHYFHCFRLFTFGLFINNGHYEISTTLPHFGHISVCFPDFVTNLTSVMFLRRKKASLFPGLWEKSWEKGRHMPVVNQSEAFLRSPRHRKLSRSFVSVSFRENKTPPRTSTALPGRNGNQSRNVYGNIKIDFNPR